MSLAALSDRVTFGRGGAAMTKRIRVGETRRVVIFALPGVFTLDVLGPYEIFVGAARLLALRKSSDLLGRDPALIDPTLLDAIPGGYDVSIVSTRAGQIETFSGALLFATDSLVNQRGAIDTLIVAGGDIGRMLEALRREPKLMAVLRRVARRARRVASVCMGSFVLAAAGLLDGRRATTHWAACELLAARHPKVMVEREPIFTRDQNVYTSAGATTGMDLSLELVREDHGSEIAREIARWLVLYVERSGSQSQMSMALSAQAADHKPLRDLQLWIAENLRRDLSVTALAARVGMSVRNFARAFKRELSVTPAAYVEGARLEAARRKLELGNATLEQVADEVGFGSRATLSRAFVRATGRTATEPPRLRLVSGRGARKAP